MHLAIYHEPVHTDGVSYDTYGPYARYVLGFARHFDQVTVFAPVTDKPGYFTGTPLDAPNVSVVPLPFFSTHAQAYRKAPAIISAFRRHSHKFDAVNARGTAPLAYLLWWMTRKQAAPFIYHFASDPFEVIETSPKYRGFSRVLARTAYSSEFAIQRYILRRNYGFTSGQAICDRLLKYTQNVEATIDSSLLDEDYYLREDSCQSKPIRVLYVGGLRMGKGLDILLRSVKILQQDGYDIELSLVGSGPEEAPLRQLCHDLGIDDKVVFCGYQPMGESLNASYNNADVFVLPSLSEGSPRVILEALAHSLPVVATRVGNIPEMLDNGQRGILLKDADETELARGIARFSDEPAFRRKCIQAGYAYARQHDLDSFISQMAEKIIELIHNRRKNSV